MLRLSRVLSKHECAVVIQSADTRQLVRGPGTVRTFWRWKRVVVVDLRPFLLDLAVTGLPTADGVLVSVSGTLGGRVVDPDAAVTKVVDFEKATAMIAETAIRAAVKERRSAEVQSEPTKLEATILETVAAAAQSWGVAVSSATLAIE
jgi:regulator of protease activity HflC (stomatin/prohibitin superfamily)